MKIENTYIDGLKLIHLSRFEDSRGSFIKVFNKEFFRLNKLATDFKESYFSVSQKNVIRGMHFQVPPYEHTKLVYLSQGGVIDVILDIRKSSPTFGQYLTIELTGSNPIALYIPVGCAHGYLSIQDNTIVSYLQTSVYNRDCDHGIKWDSFGMDWGVTAPIVSKRDMEFVKFNDYATKF